jgi:DNA polymerase elongation subunit (family B)
MDSSTGWLLDVSIEQNRATIWIKTSEEIILKLVDTYLPNFYVLPKNENTGADLFQILSQQSTVKKVEWEDKFTDLFDYDGHGMKKLICVYTESLLYHNTLIKTLEKDPRVTQLFNTDPSHVQQYLFTKLRIEPTSKVEVQYDKNDSSLIKITKINEDDELGAARPSFSILHFEIRTKSSPYNFDTAHLNDPIAEIRAKYQEEPEISVEGGEDSILESFCEYVLVKDPDILVSSSQHSRTTTLDYVFVRMTGLGLDLHLGRDKNTDKTDRIEGRVYLSNKSFRSDLDLVGLIEKAQFAFLPLTLAARYGISRLIDSRNCYELIQRGFVIPRSNNNNERIRTLDEIIAKDKGGMIFSPKIGLHENVVVLDYENEYANLILQNNLSYETIASIHDGRIIRHGKGESGLLPTILESVLKRRIFFKNLQKAFVISTNEWLWCEQRIVALKDILVSLYGTTGSFWNRFANVAAFEEINRLSREVLMKTKDIVQGLGFELVYADTDSVFLKKIGASLEDFESVKDALRRETGLPISLENYYKFLVLLPLEADEKMEALKHYFGITHTNELIARGIEIRRHDAPNFIKEFQTELLYTLFDCKDSAEVLSKGYENALLLVTKTIDKVMTGEIPLKDLVVSKMLRQDLTKYRSLFPHVSAALQLTEAGKSLVRGDMVQYIYTNAVHKNPLRRVMPLDLLSEEPDYDKEKYRDMLLEATESILGYFGFDRMVYGDRKKNRKWWYELNEQRRKDVETEKSVHDGEDVINP